MRVRVTRRRFVLAACLVVIERRFVYVPSPRQLAQDITDLRAAGKMLDSAKAQH